MKVMLTYYRELRVRFNAEEVEKAAKKSKKETRSNDEIIEDLKGQTF